MRIKRGVPSRAEAFPTSCGGVTSFPNVVPPAKVVYYRCAQRALAKSEVIHGNNVLYIMYTCTVQGDLYHEIWIVSLYSVTHLTLDRCVLEQTQFGAEKYHGTVQYHTVP